MKMDSERLTTIVDIEYTEASVEEDLVINNNTICKQESFVTLRLKADTLKNSPIVHRRSRIEEILSHPEVAAALVNETSYKHNMPRPPSPAYPLKNQFNFEDNDEIEEVKTDDQSSLSEDLPLPSENSLTTEFTLPPEGSSGTSDSSSDTQLPTVLESPNENTITKNGQIPPSNDNVLNVFTEPEQPAKSPMKSKRGIFKRFRFPSTQSSEDSLDEWVSLDRAKARVDENHRNFPLKTNVVPILKASITIIFKFAF